VVFNPGGSVASAIALLTVTEPPRIVSQPTNQFVRPGTSAVFRVTAVGTGLLRYEWRFNGVPLPGAVSATLTLTNAQLPNAGAYSVLVSDSQGSVLSTVASLVILIDPLITQQPLGRSVVAGETVTFSVSVTNTATLPIHYRWRRNGQNFTGNTFLSSERTCFLTVTNVQLPFTNYTVVISNAARSSLVSSNAYLTFVADSDGDGLPDSWETLFGFPTNNAANAAEDSDGDTLSNGQEYVAGTDPIDASSCLKVECLGTNGAAVVAFDAVSNRTYTVLYTDALDGGTWTRLADVLSRANSRTEFIVDPGAGSNRYYRVVTPQQP